MRNETAVNYNTETTTSTTTLTDARVKLAGHEVPGRQIQNKRELEAYCKSLLEGCAYEEFHVICVDCQMRVLCDSCISRGSLDSVNAYPRNIATVALLSNAYGVFLTHNHPGGTCSPSREDIASTLQIERALKLFNIMVIDHMIITDSSSYSMKCQGDF